MRDIYIPPHRPLWVSPEEQQAINQESIKLIYFSVVCAIGFIAAERIYWGLAL